MIGECGVVRGPHRLGQRGGERTQHEAGRHPGLRHTLDRCVEAQRHVGEPAQRCEPEPFVEAQLVGQRGVGVGAGLQRTVLGTSGFGVPLPGSGQLPGQDGRADPRTATVRMNATEQEGPARIDVAGHRVHPAVGDHGAVIVTADDQVAAGVGALFVVGLFQFGQAVSLDRMVVRLDRGQQDAQVGQLSTGRGRPAQPSPRRGTAARCRHPGTSVQPDPRSVRLAALAGRLGLLPDPRASCPPAG